MLRVTLISSKVKDKLLHLAPLTTKKESAASGRTVLILEAVYSSLEDSALTYILDDVKTDDLSENQSREYTAAGVQYSATPLLGPYGHSTLWY